MNIFKLIGVIILAVIATFVLSVVDMLFISKTFVSGAVGIPFRYSNGSISLFGSGNENINYVFLILDFIFWFLVLLLIINFFPKLLIKFKK